MNEKSLENKIKKHLKDNKHYYIKTHGSLFGKAGVPDIIACINSKFVGIELKNPNGKGKISKLQIYNLDAIFNSGGCTLLTDNYGDYIDFYNEITKGDHL